MSSTKFNTQLILIISEIQTIKKLSVGCSMQCDADGCQSWTELLTSFDITTKDKREQRRWGKSHLSFESKIYP